MALLLAVFMLLPMFAACGGEKTPAVTTASSEETVVTKDPNTPDIPTPEEIGDVSGEFKILVAGNYAFNDFKSEGEEGTAVDTAIYRRNAYLKDKYNIDITYDEILGFMRINGSGEGYMKIAQDRQIKGYPGTQPYSWRFRLPRWHTAATSMTSTTKRR